MNKKIVTLLCSLFLLSGCSGLFESGKTDDISSVTDEEGKISEPLDINTDVLNNPDTKYDPSVLLVKTSATSDSDVLTDDMKNLGIESIKSIAPRSEWKKATLKEGIDALSVIKKFRNSGLFEMVDFDYIYDTEEVKEETTTTTSTIPTEIADYQKQVNVDKAWKYLEDKGKDAGGDSSVIVAVIDTGVDYNHIDLKQNIWINKGEIPGNGIDDDGNGYVDDVYGWNFVGDNNDPMDDNGHGTHVAGIIGAANNDIGVTGVAYNCKVMPIKAGNSSGYFNNSDIASAITYAYMNGADVINMSFGGTSVTMAVQEALERAYSTSFLVAAAGNDGAQNEPVYPSIPVETIYPASFSFVDGVMSVGGSNYGSVFTNFDSIKEKKIEYECFAPGEYISSTFPGNRYASLSGTSMAAPVVSGIAALLRSAVPNKNEFPSKFLMSQIINTSETQPLFKYWNRKAMVVDAYKALTEAPKPDVSLYDWYTFDNKSISSKNNGDDNIDAGETVHIGVELMNRGGMAKDVTATIDVKRLADDIVDPYVTITTPTVKFSDIGTYSVRDAGKRMESDTVVDVENPFVFDVAENVPNNYQCDINIHVTWKNGLTSKDTTVYSFDDVMSVTFHRGEVLPARIDTDTTLTADKLWIVNDTVRIGEGVTVTVEPGTNIQFYEQNQSKYQYATPKILLAEGASFICNGTEDKMINIYPADGYDFYLQRFEFERVNDEKKRNSIIFKNANLRNINTKLGSYITNEIIINNSNVVYDGLYVSYHSVPYEFFEIEKGSVVEEYNPDLWFASIQSSKIFFLGVPWMHVNGRNINDCIVCFQREIGDGSIDFRISQKSVRNIFVFDAPLNNSSFILDGEDIDITEFNDNTLINNSVNNNLLSNYCRITSNYYYGNIPQLNNNHFYGYPKPIEERIIDPQMTNVVSGTGSISSVWPFVSGYQFTNDKGEETTKFSKENMNLKLYFNRAMDTTDPLSVKFGSVEPYADYIIDGTWVDEYTWQGKREIPTAIENGTQHLTVSGGRAKDDHFLTNNDNCHRISFDIDTTGAMAMNMFATPIKDGIQLEMKQDDYDTVMGYNVYRSETKDGEYARINTSVIRPEDAEQNATYLDTTVEPGKTYYYSYTAVMTDFSESHASGRTACTALDTINPIISHTPVNQGYLGSNLNINCVIRDNVGIAYAKLYYRVKGSDAYKYVDMVSANDKYSAVIPAADLSTNGMEYYIETNDGVNTITLGTKESPYQVIIKESSAVSYLGDVDGNGVIEAVDAMLVLQHINGKRVLVNDEFRRADLNGNGTLESFEALAILQYVNGNRTNLEV